MGLPAKLNYEEKEMSKRKGNAVSVDFILGLVFSIIGSVFVIIAVCFAVFQTQFEKKAVETSAVITRIENYRDGQGDSHHKVYISYEADGQTYESALDSYVSSWYEGKNIDVLVSRDNPGEVRATATSWLFPLIFGLIGLIFAVIGIIMSVLHARKKKKERWLRDNGRKIQAEVTGGRVCYNYTVNNRHPFQLECRYEDSGYGQVYLFSSGMTWLNPNDYIGSYVDVYADSSDMRRYFVDMDSLKYQENSAVIHDYR